MKYRFRRLSRKLLGALIRETASSGLTAKRKLLCETLEHRQLMAADTYVPFHNHLIPEDTNRDYSVTPLDALLVINAINQGQTGQLQGPGTGQADGPMIDVSGDNYLSAIDALQIINRLNGEGESTPLVAFSYEFADANGNPLPSNNVSTGQLFQLRTFVQDTRGFAAKGVFAAFLDLAHDNADKFQVQVGETQSFRFFYDKIRTDDTSSSFRFTLPTPAGGETTQPITLFNGALPKSAEEIGASIQSALAALPSIGTGNVLVLRDTVAEANDQQAALLRNSYEIKFVNAKGAQNVPLLLLDASNVKVQAGATFDTILADKVSFTDPGAFASAFIFNSEFGFNRTATKGTNEFDEVGAATGLSSPSNPGTKRLMFFVTLKALAQGTVTFTPNQADVSPLHDVLVFPKDTVPTTMVSYGNPFSITIAENLLAANDSATVAEDSGATQINVTSNDTAVAPRTFTITSVSDPANGTTAISTDKLKVDYTPDPNSFGTETFTYTITSNLGDTSTATVSVNVTPVNDPITVSNKTFSTNEDVALELTTAQLTAGDSVGPLESAIQQLRLSQVVTPSARGGTVVLNAGKVTYTPPAGFDGSDTFVVSITDDGQTNGVPAPSSANITVTINIVPVNNAPVAVNDTVATNEDTPLILAGPGATVNLTSNDSAGPASESGQKLAVIDVKTLAGSQGTVSKDANNNFVFTPTANFFGSATVEYTIQDDGAPPLQAKATVTINIQAVNDAPAANDDAFTVDEDSVDNVLDVRANDNGGPAETSDVLTIVSATQSANGGTTSVVAGNIVFTPAAGFVGTDTFSYTLRDQDSLTDTATVTVEVEPLVLPRARVDRVTVAEDTPAGIAISVLANDRPTVGAQVTLKSFTQPANGTVTLNNNGTPANLTDDTLQYVAPANFTGAATFTYTVNDTAGTGKDSTATVTVTVSDVNDSPVLANDSASGVEDSAATISFNSLVANDSPGVGETGIQSLTVTSVKALTSGAGSVAISGQNVVYTPSADFNGQFLFEYTATDNGTTPGALSSTATVTVTVAAVNDAPIAASDTATTPEDVTAVIPASTLLQNDVRGPASATDEAVQTLSIVAVSAASTAGGTVTLAGTSVSYTPALNFVGQDTFTYTVRDSGTPAAEATATVTVNVTAVNDAPIAGSDAVTSFKDNPLTIRPADLLANDQPGPANESGQTLKIVGVVTSAATRGQATLNADGTITFVPAPGFTGATSFQYRVEDNGQSNGANDVQSSLGTVNITVQEFVPSRIAGTVYVDETNDGQIEAAERRLAGITVTLTGVALGQNVNLSYTTLSDGKYHFETLAPGNYTIAYTYPAMMLDGKDTAGAALPDLDGDANNNQFRITIAPPGGIAATDYNFGFLGLESSYGRLLDQLASRYFVGNPSLAYNGFYSVLGPDNSLKWSAKLDGFDGVLFSEVVLNAANTEAYLTIVDASHNVYTATLGRGKFLTHHDLAGNTVIRILGGQNQLTWRQVDLAAPRSITAGKYLAAVDAIFAQERW